MELEILKMKKLYSLLAAITLVYGCTKEANIKLPEPEEKLVVTCFISPEESLISVLVNTSKPRYNTSWQANTEIKDAAIVIRSAEGAATIPYVDSLHLYAIETSEFPILPGKTYTLEAKSNDKSCSAVTTVPTDTLHIRNLTVSLQFSKDSTALDAAYSTQVADIPGQTNYVSIFQRHLLLMPYDSLYNQPGDMLNPGYGIFEDDEKQPRENYGAFTQAYSARSSEKIRYDSFIVEVWALNCSREFYLYNRSVQEAAWTTGNPFSDPVMVYTNMNNGFGCFGAYRLSKRIQVK